MGSSFASARGAEVDFRPELSFGLFHDGNVSGTGDAQDRGDRVAQLAVDLAVTRRTPSSSLGFSFRPYYADYHRNKELSYFGQTTQLSYTNTGSHEATYGFELYGTLTERQGATIDDPNRPTTFVPRSKQTYVDMRGHGEHQLRRSIFNWEIRGGVQNFSSPGGDVQTAELENSKNLGFLTSWRYSVTEKSSVGLRLDGSRYKYDAPSDPTLPHRPPTDVVSLGLVGEYTIDRWTNMSYAAGASRISTNSIGTTEAVGGLEFVRTITEQSSLTAGARRSASPGSGLGGPTIDQGMYVGYAQSARRQGLSGSIVASYWKRSPVGSPTTATDSSPAPHTQTISTSERLQWSFNRYLAFEIGHAYYDQKSADEQGLVTRYNSYGFALRWSMLGRLDPHP